MKDLPVRKPARLEGYNYSGAGYYFVTVCVKDGHEMLGRIVPNVGAATCRPPLSDIGNAVKTAIENIPKIYSHIRVDKYVIMPNHIHMILCVDNPARDGSDDGRQVAAPTMSLIIGNMKRAVSMQIGFSMWQKSFHDHIIRNEAEYQAIWKYIDENPIKWEEDRYYYSPG
jgi:REP element-mobilizing transposase RayT